VPEAADVLVIGGGIAGLSAAAAIAPHAKVVVLEGEAQIGFHSSGRSATMLHYALGDALIRGLTLASRPFFDSPPEGFSDVPLGCRMAVLIHAREEERESLDALDAEISRFASIERLDAAAVHQLCPLLKPDARYGIADRDGIRLDPHAMLQGFARQLRSSGGELRTGSRVAGIERCGRDWHITTEAGAVFSAPIMVNAAGAWADVVARLARVRPIGLQPKRRTIITFDAPPGIDLDGMPFAKTVGDELYFAPESGRLFACPMDEVPSDPCDAQPDEYEMALAAERMEVRTVVKVSRIHSRWAGLRSFAPDNHPAVGFASEAEGFFWLAGQGGAGLQTSPAMSAIAASLILRTSWPAPTVREQDLSPARFFG
jgi:D-arginine dehydrogenase